jgi:pSer/pThr/pTyr-binding forkhead associated (FHA) protein
VATFVEGEEELAPQPSVGERGSLVHLADDRAYALAKPSVTIGRLPECDVVVDDAGASRQHARIRRTESGFVLTDLGSTNGTMVNGEPIQEHVLEHGDRITIGETELEFRSG